VLVALLLVALLGAFLVYDYMGSHNRYKTCEPSMAKGTACCTARSLLLLAIDTCWLTSRHQV